MRTPVELDQCLRLLNHGPVTLISSAHAGARNVMAASWVTPLDFKPPKLTLVIDRNAYTRQLIEGAGEFALNIPASTQAASILAVGACSGRDGDKFARCGLTPLAAERIAAPLVADCLAWLECRIIPEAGMAERYDLFLAEVLAASADSRFFHDGLWHFTEDGPRTLHYMAEGQFLESGRLLRP